MCVVLPLTSSLCPVCHLLMSLCVVKPVFFSPTRCQFICSASPPSVLPLLVFLPVFFSVSLVFPPFSVCCIFLYFLILACFPFLFPVIIHFLSSFFLFFAFCVVDVLPSSASLKASLFVLYPAGLLSVLRWVPHYFCCT